MTTEKKPNNSLSPEGIAKQIEKLPPEERREVMVMSASLYAGPIPSAEEFAKYEKVMPGAAERILTMAEEQSRHRRKMESSMLEASIKNSKRGQMFAFVLGMTVIVGGLALTIMGRPWEGLSSVVLALATLAGVFVYNHKREGRELDEKK